jgi:hypothetical protein
MAQFHPFESRSSQYNGIETFTFQLTQPGIHIAPQGFNMKIGPEMKELGSAPQTARTHSSTLWQGLETYPVSRDERIPRIFSGRHYRQVQPFRELGGHILNTMNGQICPTV